MSVSGVKQATAVDRMKCVGHHLHQKIQESFAQMMTLCYKNVKEIRVRHFLSKLSKDFGLTQDTK